VGIADGFAHANDLRTLAGKDPGHTRIGPEERAHQLGWPPQRTTAAPLVRPEPNATKRMLSPSLTRPWSTASQRAMGIEAAEVLPYLSMLRKTYSGGSFRRSAIEAIMRVLA